MVNIFDRLRAKSSRFFNVRERVGFKQKIFILTRIWTDIIGQGSYNDIIKRIIPAPAIQDLSFSRQVTPHGLSINADLLITGIAFNLYSESDLSNLSSIPNSEKFYLIDGRTYSVKHITQEAISWSVTLMKNNKNFWDDSIIPQD